MRKLIAVGFWRNDLREPTTDPWRPDPRLILATLGAQPADPQVVSYLRNGRVFATYRGHSWCRFGCGVRLESMGSRDLTDGIWLWPEGLVHYVEVHGVALPGDFIADARRRGGRVPGWPRVLAWIPHNLKARVIDQTFWNGWFELATHVVGDDE